MSAISPTSDPALSLGEPPARSPRSQLAIATWALFVGLAMLLAGAGVFGTLIGVRAVLDDFNAVAVGLLGTAYYAGFVVGSRLTVRALADVGHIRVYAALASIQATAFLAAGFFTGPVWWVLIRLIAGSCLAGQYVVAESWLNQLVSNQRRGQLLSLYMLVTVVSFGVGQWLFGFVDPEALTGFALAAALTSLAVAPVALSEDAQPPAIRPSAKVSFRDVWRIAPTGFITSLLVGIAHGSFLGLGAIFATRAGVDVGVVGLFIAMPTVGNLVFNLPIAKLSDRIDRRKIGAFSALTAAAIGAVLIVVEPTGWAGWLAMAGIGAMTYPLYSVAGAYTNDHCPPELLTAAASQLVLVYGAGALLGPLIGSLVMDVAGTEGFAMTTVATHLAIGLFLLARTVQYPSRVRAIPDRAIQFDHDVSEMPATAAGVGRRLTLPSPRRAVQPIKRAVVATQRGAARAGRRTRSAARRVQVPRSVRANGRRANGRTAGDSADSTRDE